MMSAQSLTGSTKAGGTGKPMAAIRARLAALAPIVSAVERLTQKGGREVVARCPSRADADDAAAWLLDRVSRLAPALRLATQVEAGGGQEHGHAQLAQAGDEIHARDRAADLEVGVGAGDAVEDVRVEAHRGLADVGRVDDVEQKLGDAGELLLAFRRLGT